MQSTKQLLQCNFVNQLSTVSVCLHFNLRLKCKPLTQLHCEIKTLETTFTNKNLIMLLKKLNGPICSRREHSWPFSKKFLVTVSKSI